MIKHKIQSMQSIADIHQSRIEESLAHLQKLNTFPLNEKTVQHLSADQILYIEMLTSRFAKLQDYLGANVFDLFFEVKQENVDNLTMIDKLNKLEKLGIISDAHLWREMRKARNIIEHEYPDNPLLMANTLNYIQTLCPLLLDIKAKIFAGITKDQS